MTYSEILLEVADGVALVTLNRPDRLNAYTTSMGRELHEAFAHCDADDAVRAIVVTGAGRAFCAGADMARGSDAFDRTVPDRPPAPPDRPWAKPPRAVAPWQLRKPIIAAINGPAVGVGATLPLQWDIRLAAKSARIGFVFVRRGVVPEALSTWALPRLVGMSRASEWLLTGRMVGAQEALEAGLLSRVVPDAELVPTARALAAEIARDTAPVSVAVTKWLLWNMQTETDLARAEDLEARAFWWTGTQPDAREGVRAFLEKRAPQWSMRPSRDMPDFLSPARDCVSGREASVERPVKRADVAPRPAKPARRT
jgi:enoyl-CoA hydratase/carnithine racemase